jgi:hypothetical protein
MRARSICICLAPALLCGMAMAQPFSSGSTGSDGALNYPTAGTYNFDPVALNLNPAGDNIFNFTTINIASGVTLTLQNNYLRGKPVVWLATGNVTIAGTLVLDGQSGVNISTGNYPNPDWITQRVPTIPGPGGSPGGVGARPGVPAFPGLGPGGAPVQSNSSCSAGGGGSFSAAGNSTPAGPTYGNIQTVPLVGGSGGSGGCVASTVTATDASGGTGGAGGGAIRIVSTTSISITGRISANGGVGGVGRDGGTTGGGGSGGAVNLIAPTVGGNGTIYAGGAGGGDPGAGYVLINATTNTFNANSAPWAIYTPRPLIAPPLPTAITIPTVSIVSVNGVSVPTPPLGAFLTPDVTINSASSVTINISAVAVPVGTVVKLGIQSELGADQTISCNPLAGTLASSTATCSASFPTSVSRILASASW